MARRGLYTVVRRAAERYETRSDGVVTRHCFAAGAHYDAANVSFGPLIGVDEHSVAPGAGFDEHEHRGVVIVSWVLEGTLSHRDGDRVLLVEPGAALVQVTGDGITHLERNASSTEPLRFIQTTLLCDDERQRAPSVAVVAPPVHARRGVLVVHTGGSLLTEGPTFCYAVSGRFAVDPKESLGPGDSLRTDDPLAIEGSGELLVWSLPAARYRPLASSTPLPPARAGRRRWFRPR